MAIWIVWNRIKMNVVWTISCHWRGQDGSHNIENGSFPNCTIIPAQETQTNQNHEISGPILGVYASA